MATTKTIPKESATEMMAVIRMKGRYNLRTDFEETMQNINLTRVNHCVLIPSNTINDGMINKVKDHVTWGEIDAETLTHLIQKRGRLAGNKKISEAWLKEKKIASFDALAKDVMSGKISLNDLGIKKVFRLTPPSKGMKSGVRTYPRGDLGYRGKEINEYLKRCI